MKKGFRLTSLAAICSGLLLSSCGINPFGPGESGLKIFAHLGKALQKPSQMNDEQSSKTGSKATVATAQAMAKRLAKSAGDTEALADPSWLKAHGIADSGNGVYCYWEEVANKPSEEDVFKKVTGRGEVKFTYDGVPTLGSIDTAKITGIISFEMAGREYKSWSEVTDTIRVKISFLTPDTKDLTPGLITAWGKNISDLQSQGRGDTAAFYLDSLDDAAHVQYGEGHFYDAHTGRIHDGEPASFDFTMQVIHKNTVDAGKPYERYQDNEGVINFFLERKTGDPLYFTIHFFPSYYRTGTIQKGGPDGQTLVTFEYNEKTRIGKATYYNEDGDVIDTENL
ncbi:MAG: hypothetical protein JXA71_11475 [Chitinispirillaceae bacterium]|nr:hypothetical protein [Chitinispirillaceae bacterium]